MDRFWVLFLSLAVIVPLSAAGYFYYLDNPFDGNPASPNEDGYVWQPPAPGSFPSTETLYSHAYASAQKASDFLRQGDYQSLEIEFALPRKTDYTPWYAGSWMAFYFRNLHENTSKVTDRDVFRAKQWLENSPQNIYALSYLGFLYSELGWSARGNKFRQDTADDNFVEMRKFFKLARINYEASLEIKTDNVYASRQLLEIARSTCNREDLRKTFQAAVKYTQDYYYLYKSYLNALQQKWCGDAEQMFAFAREYASANNTYPILTRLLGLAHEYRASQLARKKSMLDPFLSYFDPDTSLYSQKYYRYFHDADVWEEYSKSYEVLLNEFPDYADAIYQYARTAHRSGRKQTALKYFEKAFNADAAFLGADRAYYVATIFHYANHKPQAGIYFELYLNLLTGKGDREKVAYAAEYVGWQYAIRQEYETSFPYYKRAAELSPGSAHSISNYCNALFNIHRYEEAITVCKDAIRIDPKYAWSYNILSKIYSRTGDTMKSTEFGNQYNQLLK